MFKAMLRSVKSLFDGGKKCKKPAKSASAPRFRPQLEELESRDCPSTFTVDVLTDLPVPHHTSLRQAITEADAATQGEQQYINFASGLNGNIELMAALPAISNRVDINAGTIINGATAITVTRSMAEGTGNFRIFLVSSTGIASLEGLTITRGYAAGTVDDDSSRGGGVRNEGRLTMEDCIVRFNNADKAGGGIWSGGATWTTLINCTIQGNDALNGVGGGIMNGGNMTISYCTIVGNQASSVGGGILNAAFARLSVDNSSLGTAADGSGNKATEGGGIYNNGNATFTNTVFSTKNKATVVAGTDQFSNGLSGSTTFSGCTDENGRPFPSP